jgi:hypothetical protein
MVSVYFLLADRAGDDESTTFTLKFHEPAVSATPDIRPAVVKLRPSGSVPEAILQL